MILACVLITRTRGSVSSKDNIPSSYHWCFLVAIRLNNTTNNNNNETRFL